MIEPIAKTIPILLKTVDLAIYPEGGDLVAGLPCRVYIEGAGRRRRSRRTWWGRCWMP